MSAKTRSRIAVQWLPIALFLGLVTLAALHTNATAGSKILVVENVSVGKATGSQLAQAALPEPPPKSIVTASLAKQVPPAAAPVVAPITTPALRGSIAPLISQTPAAAPAGFFTINEILASEARGPQGNVRLASVDYSTAAPEASSRAKSDEPFGLFTFVAPDSMLWVKWRKVADDIRAQEPALLSCLANETACSPAAARFAAIVKEAREHQGRVRLNFVNQRVNNAIRYTSDMTQWGTPDEWSAPFAAGKGSFETGLGDCEDYAIAKYVALRAAGVPAKQLRLLLVRDNIAHLDHAVLAANEDGHWYLLDNRWTAAVEDTDVRRFTPLLVLDDQGVKLLVIPYASRTEPRIEPMSEAVKGGKDDQAQQSSQGGMTANGLRGSVL